MVNQTKDGDILTASASGTPKMALTNAGVLKLYNATSTISNDSGDITINAASDNISLASDNLINVNDAYFAGQVGIGTASPISKLHVDGAVVGKALAIFNETGDQAIFTASASGTTKFVIEHSGRVGINDALQVGSTTTAAYSRFGTATTGHSGNLTAADDLLISGDLEIDGVLFLDGLIIANKTLGTSTITFTDTPTTAYNTLSASSWLIENTANLGQAALMVNQTKGGDIFTASASGTPKFVIDNSGKVGIGTTNPSTALEVSGTVTATDFECDGCIDEGDLETAPDIQYVATDPNQRVTTSATYADFASQSSVTVNMGGLGTHWTFDFWVLTQMDQDGTGYLELYDVTNSQSISGSEVSFTSRSPIALSATGVTMPSSGTVTFRVRGKVPGSGSYLRLFWWAIYCRRTGAGADLAEYYRSTEPLGAGDVVAINFNEDKKINKSSQAYDPSSIGIVSSEPGMVLGNIDGTRQQSDAYPVALAGRVPVKVSLEGGVIKRGDPLTSSSVPGVAMKANSAGPIIGKAMEEFNGYSGQVMAFVNLSYYNPGVDTGDEVFDQVKITDREAGTYAIDQTGNLLGLGAWHSKLEDSSPITISEGESQAILEQLSQLGNLASKTLSAAVVNIYETLSAKEIKTFALEVTENIKAGAITARELAVDGLRAVGIKTALIETELISPVPDGNLVIDLDNSSPDASESAFGKLIVKGEGGEEVASIDAEGNARLAGDLEARQASFSGKMSSNQLAVASDATIAGELHAKKIYADEIVTSELSTVDSEQSITLEEIEELLREAEEEQSLLADSTDWNINTATDSSNLDELALNNLYVTETAAMNSLSLSQSLTIGPDLIIQSQMTDDQSLTINSIDTLSAPLKLQSLALAPLEIMAGKVRIDTDGNMQITGNLYVGGQIEASGLTLRESEQENGGPASPAGGFGKLLNLLDAEGNEIASIDASGSGQFKTVSTDKLIIAGSEATTSATLLTGLVTETNATAGKAMIPAGSREITIKNPRVTDYSLIYVTPTSSTLNNVLYVKSKNSCTEETQECKPNFVVGFNQALEVDVEFNWWIIDVTE